MRYLKTLSACAVFLSAATASAQYDTVLTFDQMTGPIAGEPSTLAASVNDGAASYHAIKRRSPTESWIVKVDSFNSGTPTASLLFDWGASNLNPGRAWGIAGSDLVIGDGTTDTIYKVDTTTGTRSEYLPKADLLAQTGGDSLSGNQSLIRSDGELVFFEGDTDALWVTNGANTVVEFASNAALVNGMGDADADIDSQIAFDGGNTYFWGNGTTDSVYAYDPTAPAANPGDNITEIVTGSAISALTGNSTVGYGDMVFNPADGKVYFRELISRTFLSFDPSDPAGSLAVVLTRDQLEAGPAGGSFTIGPFSIVDGQLAWSFNAFSSGQTGYFVVPEPTTLSLLLLLVPAIRRR
jgi:hypothetical protein